MIHFFVFFVLLGLWLETSVAHSASAERIITIGRPTNEIRLEYNRLQPIAAFLADKLRNTGVAGGEVVLDAKNSVAATLQLIRSGQIDLVFETPFSAMHFIREGGAKPLMLIEREGVREYGSVVFVRADSGIRTVQDLVGRVIAFEDPGSTSAYHLPRAALERAGLQLTPLADPEADIPVDRLGYVFAGSELNVSSWVYYGRTQAGALSTLDWQSQNEAPAAYRKQFLVLQKTGTVPRMVVLGRPGLEPDLSRAAVQVLAAMHRSEEGRAALAPYLINAFHPIGDPDAFAEGLARAFKHGTMGTSP